MNGGQKKVSTVVVPAKYAGKWVAWSDDRTTIIASGDTLSEARQAAARKGEKKPWLDKIADAHIRFGGAAFRV